MIVKNGKSTHNQRLSRYFCSMSMMRLRWMMGLMGIALIALIFFQWQWVTTAIDTNEDRFQQEVMESLSSVVQKVEKREVLRLVNRQMNKTKPLVSPYQSAGAQTRQESVRFFYQFNDSAATQEELNMSMTVDTYGNVKYNLVNDQSVAEIDQQSGVVYGTNSLRRVQVLEDTVAQLKATVEKLSAIQQNQLQRQDQMIRQTLQKVNTKSQLLVTVLEEMMYSQPAEYRISVEAIDSLLKIEFSERGIKIPFEFGIWKPNPLIWFAGQTQDRQQDILQSKYAVKLFPNDLFDNTQRLSVIFPTKDQYLTGKLWFNMVSSGILLIIILLTFGYSIITILRQKKLSEMKTDFINNMTHEFKTPIATIGLAVEALQDRSVADMPNFRERYIGVIGDENKRLGNQVEKVLQMAIVDRNEMKLNFEEGDLHDVIIKAAEKIKLQLENRSGEVQMVLEATPSIVSIDATQMMHVMLNLLDNAIKYSEDSPKILIRTSSTRKKIKVSVKDHGIGMSNDAQKHIFQSFYRVSTGNRHDVKGFGLGLAFVKNIIDEHHGELDVQSDIGRGTNISFIIPLSAHE
ncbi:MAG: sensor histidine kinase [Cyclobacteriaceae bacterium]